MSDSFKHITVLLNEAVDALVQDPAGTYVDCTFGRGGHSALVLERLNKEGRLIAIDKAPVLMGKFCCISLRSLPPKGGLARIML